MKKYILGLVLLVCSSLALAKSNEINVVAAENFYGSVANVIGGKYVHVESILNNPDADPHLFTTSAKTSKAMTNAQVFIFNGVDYDPWSKTLLNTKNKDGKRSVIEVSQLMNITSKDANPHLWYNPQTFPTLAKKLVVTFTEIMPAEKAYFESNLQNFLKEHQKVLAKIEQLKSKTKGVTVTATEPVFGYMADALGFDMVGKDVQWTIMNDADPSAKALAEYQNNIKDGKVKVLFYNSQVTDPVTTNIQDLAKKNNVPVVGVTETLPKGVTDVNTWFLSELDAIDKVLK
ncbi:ABC transporter substrate-binding protein [Paraphotobacterium marinum]|uniref:ABC transporter substrate-binding protein n=1 Tax=Paraphotobacterium marinum TaxID=1755811 RepID=A0A220VGI8_9GAMM|nr:zinc ABC transporter substrate-binding protein [Paraphotobacterium marinum]ASK79528.1 ABC transporter substrate-binding protein [Paraphotobacterium marinum]